MEENLRNMRLSEENMDNEVHSRRSGNAAEMTEQEMSQHLSLCLKLAAENKINTKNAFGLHLIDIMRHMVKQNASDLQSASMSLQASSKIYAGRVEALYKDTFAFHNHLQTIVANKKVREEREADEPADCEDEDGEERRERRKTSKSRQTYLATEESVAFKSELDYTNSNPHSNFVSIKSAFTSSRTDPKLLDGLILEDDSCKLCCTHSALCFYTQKPMTTCENFYSEKIKALITKAQNLKLNSTEFSSALTSSDVFFSMSKQVSSPPPPPPEFDLPADDSFCIGGPSTPVAQEPDVEDIIERFSVLDITADLFVNEVSRAIIDDNTIDRQLLPPNSALKKILNTTEKKAKKPPTEKAQKEKPPKEPFFNRQRLVDKSVLTRGKKNELTDNDVSKWQLADVAELHNCGYEKFSAELAEHYDETHDNYKENAKITYKIIQDQMEQDFNGYFCKNDQLWNRFRRQGNICLIRPSSFGVCLGNNADSKELSTNSNAIVQSFQNLSLHNSPAGSDNDDDCLYPDADDMPVLFSPEQPAVTRLTRNSGFFEDDLNSMMVTPPELVKPVNMKFQTEPITLNTEKVKNAIWNCIEKVDTMLLSELHEKLKVVFIKDKLPLQYVFAMLLLLANEKCLLLKTLSDGGDIEIGKDILEMEGAPGL